MIEFVEELLLAWGRDRVDPAIEVGIPSPLGQMDEVAAGVGGHRCLSLTEQYAAADRRVLAVEQALRDIVSDLGLLGRQLDNLADVRYARKAPVPLVEQRRLLGMSRDVYRARVDRLHVEVAARYPDLEGVITRLEASTPAAMARQAWPAKARKAAREVEKLRQRRQVDMRKGAREARRVNAEGVAI